MKPSAVAYALLLVLYQPQTAIAADITYCKPYASKVTEVMIRMTWLRAYTSCLNSEGNPGVPASWLEVFTLVDPRSPAEVLDNAVTASIPPPGSVPAVGESGYAPGTPGWNAWCRRYFRSFDVKTGTVLMYGFRHRAACPG